MRGRFYVDHVMYVSSKDVGSRRCRDGREQLNDIVGKTTCDSVVNKGIPSS